MATSESQPAPPSMKQLREMIPRHCFEASNFTSLGYVFADLTAIAGLFLLGFQIDQIDTWQLRWAAWAAYGFAQGCVFTGLWILAHECGHRALLNGNLLCDMIGFPLHTFLLVPYFSWKFSHARHHRYANNVERDTAFVPPRKGDFSFTETVKKWLDIGEDAPLLTLGVLVLHQLLGWPMYLFFNATAGEFSLQNSKRSKSQKQSHFDPTGDIFRPGEHPLVLLTDVGLGLAIMALHTAGTAFGFTKVALLYGLPYLWVNNWIVAITYLHHNHPEAHHFENEAWTFQKGALMTIDRDFGFIGKHLFHGIIEFHVIHHLFPRIPFYHAEEATYAIRGPLGKQYRTQTTPFWIDMWKTFSRCKFVEPHKGEAGVLVWAANGQQGENC